MKKCNQIDKVTPKFNHGCTVSPSCVRTSKIAYVCACAYVVAQALRRTRDSNQVIPNGFREPSSPILDSHARIHRTEDLGWLHDGQRLFVCDPHRLFMWPPYEVDGGSLRGRLRVSASVLNSVCST